MSNWRFLWQVLIAAIVFFLHGAHVAHHAPHTYDDPGFWNKVALVGVAAFGVFVAHHIRKIEDRLKSRSTQS